MVIVGLPELSCGGVKYFPTFLDNYIEGSNLYIFHPKKTNFAKFNNNHKINFDQKFLHY